MAEELDTTIADDKASEADFGAGFAGTEGKPDKAAAKPDKATTKPDAPQPAATPRAEEPKPEPKYVQVTEADWAEVRAAAAKTASYDQQLSKAFGTIGNMQKMLNEQRAAATPAATAAVAKKFEVPKEAFAAMERDFPELAAQTRAALEAALSGLPGPGGNDAHDPAKLESLLAQYHSKRELEVLEDQFPTWRTIVGAVDVTREQPDPNNAFRKWLGGKDEAYQQRVNGSESAQVIGRAIRLFQRETAVPAKANGAPRNDARAERIRAAVQPRGDNAGAAAGKSENDEFLEGFNSR
jgi:hypothetical protein